MTEPGSYFTDGAAYERLMGRWSRAAGGVFLDWLALPAGFRWLDVGCGTGAFTELVMERCSPSETGAVDPSADQIKFAQTRASASQVDYQVGNALALPFGNDEFDVAAMALAINFVPDPSKAISEMKRVVKPGGMVATYMWDLAGKAATQEPLREALEAMGVAVQPPPRVEFTRLDTMRDLLVSAGLSDVEGRTIETRLEFDDFDDYWMTNTGLAHAFAKPILEMSETEVEKLKALLREQLPPDSEGRISYIAKANAVKGCVSE
jgi:SAM-dependent methyltransferase